MMSKRILIVMVVVLGVAGSGTNPALAAEHTGTVKGWVLDSACAFTHNLKKPISKECAIRCAQAGSPLVILGDDGVLYYPISDAMPAAGQNAQMMKFAAQRVSATGKIYARGGAHAIVISQIEALPEGN